MANWSPAVRGRPVFLIDHSLNLEGNPMGTHELLEQALQLRADERFILVEGILNSLDEPDPALDAVWAAEAERRIHAFREGRLEVIPMDEVFTDES